MVEEVKDLGSIVEKSDEEKVLEKAQMKDEKPDNQVGLIIDDDDEDEASSEEEDTSKYTGNGVVIEKKESPAPSQKGIVIDGMNKQRQGDVEHTLSEMDSEIEKQRKIAEQRVADGSAPDREVQDPNASDELKKHNREVRDEEKKEAEQKTANASTDGKIDPKNDTVQVIIDKSGLGSFTFTEEEKKRIASSKRIHLVEVEDKELKTLKVKKKLDKKTDFKILHRNFDKSYSSVVALASGYTCKMKNISAAESIRMYQRPGTDTANSILDKWSVIYDKMTDISIGAFKDFEDFCKRTAFMDYDSFLFAMLCSSYPEEDTIDFTCDKDNGGCGKDFTYKYNNKQLIRSDLISDDTKEIVANIVNASAFQDKAQEIANNSPVNNFKRIKLDDESGMIVDIYIPSVHETVENTFRRMEDNHDLSSQENRNSVVLAQSIKSVYVPDYDSVEDGDVEYYQVSDLEGLVELINQMNEIQLQILATRIEKFSAPYIMHFGFPEIKCPHCNHNWGAYDMQMDNAIFRRVQRRLSTEIE